MLDLLSFQFMRYALLAGLMVSVMCSVISNFVVLKRLAFLGAGISHAAFGGVALGVLLGVDPLYTAIAFTWALTLLIGYVSRRGHLSEDTAIGIAYVAAMALGTILLGFARSYNFDVFGYLFGNILAVTETDLLITATLGALVLLALGLFHRALVFLAFDEEMAQVVGLPVRFLYYLLLSVMALTVVIAIKVVGIVLVSALLVLPGATSFQLTKNIVPMVALSLVCGLVSTLSGLYLSYTWNLASGATIVLTATALFGLAMAVSPRRWQT
jgi:ABC-type Mn2+/Zn2+ transport system permease subunit